MIRSDILTVSIEVSRTPWTSRETVGKDPIMEGISLIEAKHESYLQLWRGRVMDCRNSGKSIAVWCEENGINIKTYYYWQKKVWDKETKTVIPAGQHKYPETQPVQFAQINMASKDPSSDADIVIRKDSWTVEIRNSADKTLLNAVLQAVTGGV